MSTTEEPQTMAERGRALPAPHDDGAGDHLIGMTVPPVALPSTQGDDVDLSNAAADRLVVYLFPGMGPRGQADPPGWMETPGAYGCTEQSCSFRDMRSSFREAGYWVMGISAQSQPQQSQAAQRLQLSYPLLADPGRRLPSSRRGRTRERCLRGSEGGGPSDATYHDTTLIKQLGTTRVMAGGSPDRTQISSLSVAAGSSTHCEAPEPRSGSSGTGSHALVRGAPAQRRAMLIFASRLRFRHTEGR